MKWCQLLTVVLCVAIISGQQSSTPTSITTTHPTSIPFTTRMYNTKHLYDYGGSISGSSIHIDILSSSEDFFSVDITSITPTSTITAASTSAILTKITSAILTKITSATLPKVPTPTLAVTCADVLNLPHGGITYSVQSMKNSPVGTVAIYTCNTGYTLSGNTTRTCGSNGQWSGSDPACLRVCSDLPPPSNGMIIYNNSSPRPEGTVAVYSCNIGYELNGATSRICESDGGWSGLAATCQETACGPPPSIDDGSPGTPSSTVVRGQVMYSCDPGLVHSGSSVVTCLSTGNWSTPPICQSPPHVYLSLSSTNYLSGIPEISVSSVGVEGGLVCYTNLPDCCESEGGNWYYPNGSVVMTEGVLYVRRGDSRISLQLSSVAPPDTGGLYCCEVPISGGIDSTQCIILTTIEDISPHPQSDCKTAVVVGAVVVVLVVVVLVSVIAIVLVTYMYRVLKHKRRQIMTVSQDIPLTDQGQNSAHTYDTINYEEILAAVNVKSDCTYTQNEAYQTVNRRDNTTPSSAPIEVIYEN